MENGVKPIWVFDGKPPLLKNGEVQNNTLFASNKTYVYS